MTPQASNAENSEQELLAVDPWITKWIVLFLKKSAEIICVGSLAVLFVALLLNVLLRYAFGSGIGWAYDIHMILFPWMIGAGAVLATIHGRHVAITLLRDTTPEAVARFVFILASLLVVAISIGVVWSSYPIMRAARFQRIAALGGISQLWGYLSITYTFCAIAALGLIDVFNAFRSRHGVRRDAGHGSLS